jgi:hypothetical protein
MLQEVNKELVHFDGAISSPGIFLFPLLQIEAKLAVTRAITPLTWQSQTIAILNTEVPVRICPWEVQQFPWSKVFKCGSMKRALGRTEAVNSIITHKSCGKDQEKLVALSIRNQAAGLLFVDICPLET